MQNKDIQVTLGFLDIGVVPSLNEPRLEVKTGNPLDKEATLKLNLSEARDTLAHTKTDACV
jgi:hypothetical protein